jgi:hypothetical protein
MYVEQTRTATLSRLPSVIVPAFAVHWAVMVDKNPISPHVPDRNDHALDSADPFRNGASIKFYAEYLGNCPVDEGVVVGKTKYS